MKIKFKEKIDGYTVITQVADAVADPQKTMAKIANLITPEMDEDNIRKIFNENPVYAKVGPEAELIDDAEGERIIQELKLTAESVADREKTMAEIANLITPEMTGDDINRLYTENLVLAKAGGITGGEKLLLLDTGKYIVNNRNVEYRIKKSGKWEKVKIEKIGVTLPEGAVLQESLTGEHREEISAQEEEERLAALTPEERTKEETAKIKARLEEIDRLDGPRSLREAVACLAESNGLDTSYIMRHEEEAEALRQELSTFTAA